MENDFRLNIVTLGKTDVGKSSLLNYLFGTTFKTGVGKPVTPAELVEIDAEANGKKIRVFDSWGIEVDKLDKWKIILGEAAKEHGAARAPKDWFHAIVYCIQAGGAACLGISALLKAKGNKIPPKEVVCIRLSDVMSLFISQEVQKKLSENKNLRLFAIKAESTKNGKPMQKVILSFWNLEKNNYDSPDLASFVSEKIDDELNEKFGQGRTWTVREAIL